MASKDDLLIQYEYDLCLGKEGIQVQPKGEFTPTTN